MNDETQRMKQAVLNEDTETMFHMARSQFPNAKFDDKETFIESIKSDLMEGNKEFAERMKNMTYTQLLKEFFDTVGEMENGEIICRKYPIGYIINGSQ